MSRRMAITLAAVAVILFIYGGPLPLVYHGLLGFVGLAMFVISVLITLVLWGMAVVESVKRNRWLWVAALDLLLPLAPFVMLIYGIAGPGLPAPQRIISRP